MGESAVVELDRRFVFVPAPGRMAWIGGATYNKIASDAVPDARHRGVRIPMGAVPVLEGEGIMRQPLDSGVYVVFIPRLIVRDRRGGRSIFRQRVVAVSIV